MEFDNHWSEAHQQVFEALRQPLTERPLLVYPDMKRSKTQRRRGGLSDSGGVSPTPGGLL